jgi:outer membrane protein TolC
MEPLPAPGQSPVPKRAQAAPPVAQPAPRVIAQPGPRVISQPGPRASSPPAVEPLSEPARVKPGTVPLSLTQAVQIALRRHPSLITARANLESARGVTHAARGPYDVTLGLAASHAHTVEPTPSSPLDPDSSLDQSTLAGSVGTNLVWGTNIAATVNLLRIRTKQRFIVTPMGARESSAAVNYLASPMLTIIQPILRNAGRYGFNSAVIAGQYAEKAAEHTLEHAGQLQAFNVINAYWTLVGADSELTLFQDAQARSQRMLSETQVLVEADQRPRGDLRALEAGHATRRREVIEALRARVRAIHELRLAMGLELAETADWAPTDSFPAPALPPLSPVQLAERALVVRRDLQAASETVRSTQALEKGADRNTLPKLDLTAAVGYNGASYENGFGNLFNALGRNVAGLTASGGVSLEVPLGNSAARGLLEQAAAQRLIAETTRDDLARTLRTNVIAAYDDLRAEVDSLAAAREAETAYTQALDDERAKLRAGLATVLDTVLTEDLLTEATRARIGTELALAQALARLRLELGTLPSSEAAAPNALAGVLDAGVIDDR